MKIAILGAECTGKTQLAKELVKALACHAVAHGVPEVLREWCDRQGRTPRPEEQMAIAQEQALRAQTPLPGPDFLVTDTAPLMTAIYSDLLFNDLSLYAFAQEHHHLYDLTLLTGLDLEWVADGLQRDGPQSQAPVDSRIREVLASNGFAYAVVYGTGAERTRCALQAIFQSQKTPRPHDPTEPNWEWRCEKCSDAACEHRLFSRLLQDRSMRL